MKNIFLPLLILAFFACANTNKSLEHDLYSALADKEWTIQTGDEKLWNSNSLVLTIKKDLIESITKDRKDKEHEASYLLQQLIFKKDGIIEYSKVVKGLALCGNGLMEINTGTWQLNNDILNVDLEGNHAFESKFHYKIEYHVSFLKGNKMKLQKVKNIIWDVERY
jgi:hypothetical protein